MTNKMDVYLLPERWRVLSGSWLKIIAMVSMVIDHVALHLLRFYPDYTVALFSVGSKQVSWYFLMRCIGRLAFPLFAFLLVEGFLHTHDRMKYGRNLLLFALLSEIPFDLAHQGCLFAPKQNVFFTLFLGFLALHAVGKWESGHCSSGRLACSHSSVSAFSFTQTMAARASALSCCSTCCAATASFRPPSAAASCPCAG